ncbi:hypothetical protein [Micromonospora sonneratiae]|uniref:Uncharacterized protein n=1 Tax=Micromonospora sonneratiae TaxID=1184706 RepID=A0ABW3YFQ5_9ACTN
MAELVAEIDVLAGFMLVRASAGLRRCDGVYRWRPPGPGACLPLWEMNPADADEYFGLARVQALMVAQWMSASKMTGWR